MKPKFVAIVLASMTAMAAAQGFQAGAPSEPAVRVEVVRTPDGGIQPQVVVDAEGTLHLLYYKGDPKSGDLFYTKRGKGATDFSGPLRVNSIEGSVVAIGTDRGGQVAIGKDGAVHVAWNGSAKASEKGSHERSPMLYARKPAGADAFEPQRNLMTASGVLDGGGSVAADSKGKVYVVWHGVPNGSKDRGESARRVFVAISHDDGATFGTEAAVSAPENGACGCCGLKAGTDAEGNLLILYRAAERGVNRDTHLLRSSDYGKTFSDARLDSWNLKSCPMTTASISHHGAATVVAWESHEDVRWARLNSEGTPGEICSAPESRTTRRRYPSAAVDSHGRVLLAWTEGMAWGAGGTVHWAAFESSGKALAGASGSAPDVPAWSLVSVFAVDGKFVVMR
ncbi:hypothetical protein PHYC_00644 [Phycisphaerales bacterium]|nr:hypothetical protein PHYC_00644 [Phycisphaerales bacterium]